MGGFFAVASKEDCVADVFYGTDYHSHLGTRRGGMAVMGDRNITRFIHDITNAQFRSKFDSDIGKMAGRSGIGVISDNEDQPLIIGSHLGVYAIVTVGAVKNVEAITMNTFKGRTTHFSEMSGGEINATELTATLINTEASFAAGIKKAQDLIQGSSSMLILSKKCIYAARDKLGRTPIAIGKKEGAYAATMETCAFPNLGFKLERYLGPGEIVRITADGVEQLVPPGDRMQICSFLWVYYGYPASSYEGINVEDVRNRCGAALARNDDVEVDYVGGIPDSGTGHALGYANHKSCPYKRTFVKYTPTWPRSFMPQDQRVRDMVAKMKLIPVKDLIAGQRLLFCEDSIVRGTQLRGTIKRLYDIGAKEVHMRPACPALLHGCKFLNFSQSRSEFDLAGVRAINALEGNPNKDRDQYADPDHPKCKEMADWIGRELGLTTLKYQRLDDLVDAIGLPKEKLCTYCWDGAE